MKNYNKFSRVWDSQSVVGTSLYLLQWINGNALSWNFCSTQYILTHLLCSLVRYRVEQSRRNSISPHTHVFLSIYPLLLTLLYNFVDFHLQSGYHKHNFSYLPLSIQEILKNTTVFKKKTKGPTNEVHCIKFNFVFLI